MTVDFEVAMCQALSSVLPQVTTSGCLFHWSQAVWRKAQELGLQVLYHREDNTYKYIHKLLSIPYLPAEHINAIFTKLQQKATTEPLQELTNYISATLLNSNLWPKISRSVFGCYTRTNNDVEGWHCRMKKKAKKG